jgi:hypothetical protein
MEVGEKLRLGEGSILVPIRIPVFHEKDDFPVLNGSKFFFTFFGKCFFFLVRLNFLHSCDVTAVIHSDDVSNSQMNKLQSRQTEPS